MPSDSPRILVTGASGKLGRLVVDHLLATAPGVRLAATVRDAKAGEGLASRGVEVRVADYRKPETLDRAFAGVDRLLLVSSSEVGQRVPQHRNVIDAARRAGVAFLAYTSILHADTSPLGLAEEHRQTEAALQASGLPFAVLRNGWYTENYTAAIPAVLAHGALMGSAGEGLISAAARADYAEAAAAVLVSREQTSGRIYELAGDTPFTLAQLAAEIARQAGKTVAFRNLPEADYRAVLIGAGLPEALAGLVADSDAAAATGALFDDSRTLGRLIGHPTTPMPETVAVALRVSA